MEQVSPESAEIETLESMRREFGKYAQLDLEGMVKRFEEGEASDEV